MATDPNHLRQTIVMSVQEEYDVEAMLAEQMLMLIERFNARIARRRGEINRVRALPDHPLVDYGRYILERMTGADMRNSLQLLAARNEMLRSMAEKQESINNYNEM